jgi:lipid II:glycine glycyltransferase (peptidoglycan interpeptide bridge formation enzyme)
METAIESLQEWDLTELSHNLQKAVKRAGRSPLEIVDAVNPSQGSVLFQFYKATVKRHGGDMRYTEKYFQALIELSKAHSNLRCVLAISGGEIAGFLVVVLHQNTAYDLHCCMNQQFRRYNPSDFLTSYSISWAKGEGMERYNLGPSPLEQASLVAYKEKWGGVTRQQKTYELALRPMQTVIFKTAASLYQRMPNFMRLASKS